MSSKSRITRKRVASKPHSSEEPKLKVSKPLSSEELKSKGSKPWVCEFVGKLCFPRAMPLYMLEFPNSSLPKCDLSAGAIRNHKNNAKPLTPLQRIAKGYRYYLRGVDKEEGQYSVDRIIGRITEQNNNVQWSLMLVTPRFAHHYYKEEVEQFKKGTHMRLSGNQLGLLRNVIKIQNISLLLRGANEIANGIGLPPVVAVVANVAADIENIVAVEVHVDVANPPDIVEIFDDDRQNHVEVKHAAGPQHNVQLPEHEIKPIGQAAKQLHSNDALVLLCKPSTSAGHGTPKNKIQSNPHEDELEIEFLYEVQKPSRSTDQSAPIVEIQSKVEVEHFYSDNDSDVGFIDQKTGKTDYKKSKKEVPIVDSVAMIYPMGDKGLGGHHLKALMPKKELNDDLIRFAFKYEMDLMDTDLSKKILVADSFADLQTVELPSDKEYLVYPYLYKKGTMGHWILVIATGFQKLFQDPHLLSTDIVLEVPYKISFLNSLPGTGEDGYGNVKKDIEGLFEKTFKNFLNLSNNVSIKHTGTMAIPKLFGQINGKDCGIYIIEYFKYFFSCEDVRKYILSSNQIKRPEIMEMEKIFEILKPRWKVGLIKRKMLAKVIFALITKQKGKQFCHKLRRELEWDKIDFGPNNNHPLLARYQ